MRGSEHQAGLRGTDIMQGSMRGSEHQAGLRGTDIREACMVAKIGRGWYRHQGSMRGGEN